MFQFLTNSLISLVLIVAVTLSGVVPVIGAGNQCGSEQCCRTRSDEAVQSCCSTPTHPHICQCSVKNKRPPTPVENRTSDKRDLSRRADCVAVASVVCVRESQTHSPRDATLFSFQPIPRQQAVLCCWLI